MEEEEVLQTDLHQLALSQLSSFFDKHMCILE